VSDSIVALIRREVSSWDGVTVSPHRYGGLEFRVGRRELGHLHGDRLADLPFPVAVRNELIAAGRAERHHILPDSGWVSVGIRNQAHARTVIDLFRLNYDRPWLRREYGP
jgi:luciferase-like monooxygenase